jgi:phosphinothricin acetyltransferase
MEIRIGPFEGKDWETIRDIFLEGIATGNATFETDAPSWEKWDAGHLVVPRLAARDGTTILGWAALSPVSSRCVYAGVAEVSIYVGLGRRGLGIGKALLEALITASEQNGIWTLQAGMFPENVASVKLHERCGFRLLGRRGSLGKLAGRWRDVLLMERRSRVTGID